MTGPPAPWLFRLLVRLFPRRFREAFGDEMGGLFEDQRAEAQRSRGAVARLWLRTVRGMTSAAWHERVEGRRLPGLPRVGDLTSDLRFGSRMARRSPLFSMLAVAAISLGVGGVATIFSALNAIVLRPLPGTADGGRLVGIDRRSPDFTEGVSGSVQYYEYLRDNSRALTGTAAWSRVPLSIVINDQAVATAGSIVSGNYFDVLGVRPEVGRFFDSRANAAASATPEVVLAHTFWTTRLQADPAAVGRFLTVNGRPYRIIGVAPEGFRGVFTPLKIDAWVPLGMPHHLHPSRDDPSSAWLWMFGRLGGGVAPAQARTELATLTGRWTAAGRDPYTRYSSIRLTPLSGLPDDARTALLQYGALLLGAAGLVLIIAGANVSSLLAMRAVARRREMAIRTALGASRWRLGRQLLVETLMLFAGGAAGGMLLAIAGTSALERIPIPLDTGLSLELSPDVRVLIFTVSVALATGLLFGIGPAIRGTGRNPANVLRSGTPGSGRRTLLTGGLIVAQLACSMVLLAAAGLFLRALAAGAREDPGFDANHVVVSTFDTQSFGYDAAAGRAFYDGLARHLLDAPGIDGFTFANEVPLTVSMNGTMASVRRSGAPAAHGITVETALVAPGYLATLHIRLADGRAFAAADDARSAPVAMVNSTFARQAWPGGTALGRMVNLYGEDAMVIGVAADAKYSTLTEGHVAFVYEPIAQHWTSGQTLFLRSPLGSADAAATIRRAVAALDPRLPQPSVTPLPTETALALLPQRVAAMITGVLGGAGLTLAAIGLYGLLSYAVALRRRDLGVRLALGARGGDVIRMMLAQGLRLSVAGLLLGLGAARIATPLLRAYLPGVGPLDPLSFAGAAATLLLVALAAAYVPARRAAAADPLTVLRSE